MFEEVVVPLDGSRHSARALGPALTLAAALDSPLHLVTFAGPQTDVAAVREQHEADLGSAAAHSSVESEIHIERSAADAPTGWLESWLDERPGALVCMATHGRGRSAAVLGSVATDVIRHRSGPVLLIGPEVGLESFAPDAPLLVPLDATDEAERIMPIVEAWAIVFHNEIELMQVVPPAAELALRRGASEALTESAYLRRIAAKAEAAVGRAPSYDVFHESNPGRAIIRRARQGPAGLVSMSTHGLMGTVRLLHGSVMAEVVRHSPCPVLTVRPPAFC